jgi:hypothetical protein
MREDELLNEVMDLCRKHNLLYFHAYDSRMTTGKGFPDLVVCGKRIIFIELKSEQGTMRPEQTRWRYALQAAGAMHAILYPSDLASGAIEACLEYVATFSENNQSGSIDQ